MAHQHPQNMHKQSATIDNPDSAISHKDKSPDVLKGHQEQDTAQVKAKAHSPISPFVVANADAHGPEPSSRIGQSACAQSSHGSTDALHSCSGSSFRYCLDLDATMGPGLSDLSGSSGSGDKEPDDSAYLASGSEASGYDGLASSVHSGSRNAGDTRDGSPDEECASYGAINMQAGKMPKEQTRGCREMLGLDGVAVELQRMRSERGREMECLAQEAELQSMRDERSREFDELKRMLDKANQEVEELQSLSPAEKHIVRHDSLARPRGAAAFWSPGPAHADEVRQLTAAWFDGRDQAQAGPVAVQREMSALPNSGQRERPWQSSAQAPTGPRPLPSSASAASRPLREEVGGEGGHADQAPASLPGRKRTLRPLPSWARTVIVRNVPWSYSQEDLLAVWPPSLAYDYFHTPYHCYDDHPLGHAYINFVTYEAAAAFQDRWHGRYLSPRDKRNTLDVTIAFVQGRRPNLARIHRDKIPILLEKRFLPVLLDDKRRLDTHEVLAEWSRSCFSCETEPVFGAFQ